MALKRIQVGDRMSQAVMHGDTVYTAGQVALEAPGELRRFGWRSRAGDHTVHYYL